MPHLSSLSFKTKPEGGFPFAVPAIRALERLEFKAPITLFVGENGSGKSTLLEAVACAADLITAGSDAAARDETLAQVQALAETLRLSWQARTHRGFFLRAEDFFGYAKRMAALKRELEREVETLRREYTDKPATEFQRVAAPYTGQLRGLGRYGEGLDAGSHGESFLRFFKSRLVPGGLYLLDEPEAPLSPLRQLSLLALIKDGVQQGSQFVIATHSPILMALPGATLLSFDSAPPREVAYGDLEHVLFMKAFLADPERFLRHL